MRAPRPGAAPEPGSARAVVASVLGGLTAAAVIADGAWRGSFGELGVAFVVLAVLTPLVGLRPLSAAGVTDVGGGADLPATFLLAILLGWGAAPALAVHVVARAALELTRGRGWRRAALVVGQRSLGLAAAGAIAARGELGPELGTADLPVVAPAALVLFLLDGLVTDIARPAHNGRARRPAPGADLRGRLAAGAALLSLAPLLLVAAARSAWLVPLLLPALRVVARVGESSRRTEHEARHDGLTGLPNRTELGERAAASLAAAARSGTRVGLLLLDLDRFKEVNDRLGHDVGDRLLVVAAARLAAALRPGDAVARLGGDEFAVLLPALPAGDAGRTIAAEVAGRVRGVLRAPYEIDGQACDVDASIGVALYPDHGPDLPALSRCADLAMYTAKQHRLGVQMYGPRDARRVRLRAQTTAELGYALANGQLEVHYQPQAEIADGRVYRVEALVRWRHPSRGVLLPEVFVPLAETAGLIRPITSWVMASALAQVARWHAAGIPVAVALNASARDLRDPGFVSSVGAALAARGLPPAALTFEVTERAVTDDPDGGDGAARALHGLADLGVTVSLDDFGTGCVSLEALRRLPFGELKIDRTVIRRMTGAAREADFVRAVVRMGSDLGLRVVAEGVETPLEWYRLAGFGCDAAQGWHVAPALPAALITPWLASAARAGAGGRPGAAGPVGPESGSAGAPAGTAGGAPGAPTLVAGGRSA